MIVVIIGDRMTMLVFMSAMKLRWVISKMLQHGEIRELLKRSHGDTNISKDGQGKYIHESIGFFDGATQDCFRRGVVEVMETQVECPALLSAGCRQPPSFCCINRFFNVGYILTLLHDRIPGVQVGIQICQDEWSGCLPLGTKRLVEACFH